MGICAEWLKGTDLGERGQIAILVGLQDRDDDPSFRVQSRQEFGRHTLPIHDHPGDVAGLYLLLIALQKCGKARGEMLISSMGGDEQRMALGIMQQQERSAPQDDAQPPDQPTREEQITVDRFAVTIEIAGQCLQMVRVVGFCCSFNGMPQMLDPGSEHIGEAFGPIGTGNLR